MRREVAASNARQESGGGDERIQKGGPDLSSPMSARVVKNETHTAVRPRRTPAAAPGLLHAPAARCPEQLLASQGCERLQALTASKESIRPGS